MLARAERKNVQWRIDELTAKLAIPPFPVELHFIWKAHGRIRRRLASGMDGPQPIPHEAIVAFQAASEMPLKPWEVAILEALDDLYLRVKYEAAEQDRNPDTAPASDSEASREILFRGVKRKVVSRPATKPTAT